MLEKTTPNLNFTPKGLYIGGEWQESTSGKTFETINPSNREKLGDVPDATEKDIDRAVAAAKAAFGEWSRVPIAERARCLEALARLIDDHAEELALMDAVDAGNALSGMRGDMEWTARTFRYFAGLIPEIKGESSSHGPRHLNITRRQPYGVVAKINPFNHPFRFCAEKAAAPLAAGNCVAIKGSQQAPLSSLRLGELCDGIFPKGVVNIVTGGAKAGAALVSHPDVGRIGFIGSVPTGRAIAKAAAETLKVVSPELGGKNPFIAFPDADPEAVANAAVSGMNFNWSGQSCGSTSRVMLHESLYDEVITRIEAQVSAIKVGNPLDKTSGMGPINSEKHFRHVMGLIDTAKQEGARLVTGGSRPEGKEFEQGYWVRPTVFADVTMDMKIARVEVFGPVLSVLKWRTTEEAIEMANCIDMGLTAAIWTNDIKVAIDTARKVESGLIWINGTGRHYMGTGFAGWKNSGLGREECLEEVLSYTQSKSIHIIM